MIYIQTETYSFRKVHEYEIMNFYFIIEFSKRDINFTIAFQYQKISQFQLAQILVKQAFL
jgi:hypothetical protein